MGLTYLEAGSGDYLKYKAGEVVSIFGHPGEGAMEPAQGSEKQGRRPLRVSYGKEIKPTDTFLFYDADTLQGSSGSPVIGRGGQKDSYAVKGIHVGWSGSGPNGAQGLLHLKEWIG